MTRKRLITMIFYLFFFKIKKKIKSKIKNKKSKIKIKNKKKTKTHVLGLFLAWLISYTIITDKTLHMSNTPHKPNIGLTYTSSIPDFYLFIYFFFCFIANSYLLNCPWLNHCTYAISTPRLKLYNNCIPWYWPTRISIWPFI